ncbi:unnamed protein product [Spirodela intermedia]|uniref:Bulb-type lectin domain-containing protein n=1 Tax=Spirodela intermedia TaxID=51605 RepID=A0A7I8K4Q3_SPIIN|nr:unnamed protein product [Spirodela intermedia]
MVARNIISLLLLILPFLLLSPCSAKSELDGGESLVAPGYLENGRFTLRMQLNCNLVLRYDSVVVWCSGTAGRGTDCRATMQRNGNFVIRSGSTKVWETNSAGAIGTYVLVLKDNGNLVIYKGQGQIIWERGTRACTAVPTMAPLKNASSIPADVATIKP